MSLEAACGGSSPHTCRWLITCRCAGRALGPLAHGPAEQAVHLPLHLWHRVLARRHRLIRKATPGVGKVISKVDSSTVTPQRRQHVACSSWGRYAGPHAAGIPFAFGEVGEWSLDKRHYMANYPPRSLEPPPECAGKAPARDPHSSPAHQCLWRPWHPPPTRCLHRRRTRSIECSTRPARASRTGQSRRLN
jgi:hypothetical protein